jgi:hypothetical protein
MARLYIASQFFSPRGLRIRPLDPASIGRLHRPVRSAVLTNPAQGTASLETLPKGVPPLELRPTVRRLDAARALPLWTGQQGRAAPDNPARFPLPGKPALATPSCVKAGKNELPEFHPQTLLRDRGNGKAFQLAGAPTRRLRVRGHRQWQDQWPGQTPVLRLPGSRAGTRAWSSRRVVRQQKCSGNAMFLNNATRRGMLKP